MFVTPAYAQAQASNPAVDFLTGPNGIVVPMLIVLVIMYFMVIRPQRQQQKKHKDTLANIRRGDTVVTAGGIIGRVSKVPTDTEVEVEIAEGVRIKVVRSTITDVRAKGEPVKDKE
jgi:preprotein translocase subunit YajC